MKSKRLSWAKKHKTWTAKDWKKVLFDESHFYVRGENNRFVRRSIGEPLNYHHVNQTVKHPQKKMFWGCFSYADAGFLSVADLENFGGGGDFKHKTSKIRMSSPKLRVIFRPKSEIQTFFSPKIRWSPKKKYK